MSEWIITEPIQWCVSLRSLESLCNVFAFSHLLSLLLFPLPRLVMLQSHRGIGLAYHLSAHPRDISFLIKVLIYCQVSLWLLLFLAILPSLRRQKERKGEKSSPSPPSIIILDIDDDPKSSDDVGEERKEICSIPCKLLDCKLPRIIITSCPYLSWANDCDI